MRLARALSVRGMRIAVTVAVALGGVTAAMTASGAAVAAPTDTTTTASGAGAVSVTPYNGGAWLQWSNPPDLAAVRQFDLTATPSDASLQSTVPARVAHEAGAVVPGDQHSFFFGGLEADCHTEYTFAVSAIDEAGAAHAVGTTAPARPSGYLGRGDPPLVEVVVDGAPSSFDLPGPVTYDPLDQSTYCPEQPFTAEGGHLATSFRPDAMQEPLLKWFDLASGLPGPFDAAGDHTHWYLDDAYAATGAVVLPFSYRGATLTRNRGGAPQLTVEPYSRDDTTNGLLDAQAWALAQEIGSIHRVWPSSRILVLGHSYGGLVAEWYWQTWWPSTNDHDGVVHVFSLDSPINGVSKADTCQENLQALLFCSPASGYSQTLFGVWSILWDGRAEHDAAIVAVDRSEGFPYTAVYTRRDPTFYGIVTGGFADERIAQAVFPLDAGVSYQSPCDVPDHPDWVQNAGHFLVKSCAGTIAHIQELVRPPVVGCRTGPLPPCRDAGPHGPTLSSACVLHAPSRPSVTVATATEVGGAVGEPVTFSGGGPAGLPSGGNRFWICGWNGTAQPSGSASPYDVSVAIGVSDPYASVAAARAQFQSDSEYRAHAGGVLGAVDIPLGDGGFSWVESPSPSAAVQNLAAGTQSLEVLAGNRIVTVAITSIGEDQRAHGQQEQLARLVLRRLGISGPTPGPTTSTSTTAPLPPSTSAAASTGRGQFIAAAGALCRATNAQVPSFSDPTDLPGIASTARAAIKVYPGYLRQATVLAATQPDHADLVAQWIAPEQGDWEVALPVTQQFLAAVQRGDRTGAVALLEQLAAQPDHRSQVESYLNGIGLGDCAALEAR